MSNDKPTPLASNERGYVGAQRYSGYEIHRGLSIDNHKHLRELEYVLASDYEALRQRFERACAEITRLSGEPASPVETFEPLCQMSPAAADVIAERLRQLTKEGWTPAHDDDEHDNGQLAKAAACYAAGTVRLLKPLEDTPYNTGVWPWSSDWWKPKDRRRDLVRAGALILAEIERLDRASEKAGEESGAPRREAGDRAGPQVSRHSGGAKVHCPKCGGIHYLSNSCPQNGKGD